VCATAGVAPPSQAQAVALNFDDEISALEPDEFRALSNSDPTDVPLSSDTPAADADNAPVAFFCPLLATRKNATTFCAAAESLIQASSSDISSSPVIGA
jgi:hypothetical protein